MVNKNGIRAFSDKNYDYYELTVNLGLDEKEGNYLLPKGSIFVHDEDDCENGSTAQGCLKLCWTPDGNCYGWLCANTVILHAAFKDTCMMRRVQSGERSKIKEFEEKIESLKNDIIELEDQLTQILRKPQNKGRR